MPEIIALTESNALRPSACLGHALRQRAVALERLWCALIAAQPAILSLRSYSTICEPAGAISATEAFAILSAPDLDVRSTRHSDRIDEKGQWPGGKNDWSKWRRSPDDWVPTFSIRF